MARAVVLGVAAGLLQGALAASPVLSYPKTCPSSTEMHGATWPTRFFSNDCYVGITENANRSGARDINIVVMSPYVGSLGDTMTMAEPLIQMAAQEVEDSELLPGYRMKFKLADSRCTGPDATAATIRVMSQGPTMHGLIGDSCSGSCAAINDAIQPFNVLHVSPNCISTGLSSDARYPFFTRLTPSFRFNVIATHELTKYLGFKRVGIVYGPRDITVLAKNVFLELVGADLAARSHDWTILLSVMVSTADEADTGMDLVKQRDSRIIVSAMYEDEGSLALCAAAKRGMQAPDYFIMGASGWWNQNFISLRASSTACTEQEIFEAGFGMIGVDRGGMLNFGTHTLSGRPIADIANDYTTQCMAFAGGAGACNYGFSPYFYDTIWHFALIMHKYLIFEGGDYNTLVSEAARQRLFDLSLIQDYQGLTGRVRQYNGVDPATTAEGGSIGDREGDMLLRQLVGPNTGDRFNVLGYWSPTMTDWKEDIVFSRTDPTKKLSCSGSTCDFANAFLPSDRSPSCQPGAVWSLELGCEPCRAGYYASVGTATVCTRCELGRFNNETGQSTCRSCPLGTAAKLEAAEACSACEAGSYADRAGASECQWCPRGSYSAAGGAESCASCPTGLTTEDVASRVAADCTCSEGSYQDLDGSCRPCGEGLDCPVGSRVSNIPAPGAAASGNYPKVKVKYYTRREEPLSVYECLREDECPGGPPATCAPNRGGIACGSCDDGYFADNEGGCQKCADIDTVRALWPTVFVVVLPCVIFAFAVFVGQDVETWYRPQNAIQSLIFVAFAYTQTIALHAVLKLQLPNIMSVSTTGMSVFLSPLKVFNMECADFQDFTAGFVARVLLPLYCAGICVLAIGVGWIVSKMKPGFGFRWPNVVSLFGSFYNTLYISIASQTFSLFMCYDHPNDKSSLRISSDVLCYEGEWNSLIGVSVVAILVFCVGSVALFVYLLRIAPRHVQNQSFRLSVKFLFNKFRVGYGFWSIVVLVKGLWITLSTVLFTEVVGQIMWLNAGMVVYTLLTATCYPFRAFAVSIVDIIAHAVIFYVYNGSTFFAEADSDTVDRVGATNTFIIFFMYAIFLVAAVYQIRQMLVKTDTIRKREAEALSSELCKAFKVLGSQPENLEKVLVHLSLPEIMILNGVKKFTKRETGLSGELMEGSVSSRLTWSKDAEAALKPKCQEMVV